MSAARTLLVELRTEELPPALLGGLARDFAAALHERLRDELFCPLETQGTSMDSPIAPTPAAEVAGNATEPGRRSYATSRRLVAVVDVVMEKSAQVTAQRRGPRKSLSYGEDGEPTRALQGFLRSAGARREDLVETKHKGKEYVAVPVTLGGEVLEGRIGGIIEAAVQSIVAPRMMRWGAGSLRFVRPIHGILIVHGERTLTARPFGLDSSDETVGHRFLSPGRIKVAGADAYVASLARGKVMVDADDRTASIEKQARDLEPEVDMDETLLAETAAMCEWPKCYRCSFDGKYLELPPMAVIGCMEKHLRCFPVFKGNELCPRFIYVADNEPSSEGLLVAGVERVMRARLDDALYIYRLDLELDNDALLSRLEKIAYVRGFGSMRDHCERVSALVRSIARSFGLGEGETDLAANAARLHKADLGTLMVAEHPDLEGYMAAEYLSGEPDSLRALIRDLPSRGLDEDDGNAERDCLVVASEAERLVGLGKLLGLPSSSSDPHALRRSMARITRVLARHGGVDLGDVVAGAYERFTEYSKSGDVDKSMSDKFPAAEKAAFVAQVKRLALRRIAQHRADILGLDVFPENRTIHAVLGLWASSLGDSQPNSGGPPFDVAEMRRSLKAVHEFIEQRPKAFENLITASKRLSNIAAHDHGKGSPEKAAEATAEGAALLGKCGKITAATGPGRNDDFHARTLEGLAGMRPEVDAFFDNVRILDAGGKDNHNLALVKHVEELFETLVCKTSSLYKGADWLSAEE